MVPLRRIEYRGAEFEEMSLDAVLTPVLARTTPPIGHLSPRQPFDVLFPRLLEYGPSQTSDLTPEEDWDVIVSDLRELATAMET